MVPDYTVCVLDSAALTHINGYNLHFSAGLIPMGSKAKGGKTQQGVNDVQGDGSRRRGAVANFMPCIFLSCMANSQSGRAR